MVEVGSQLDEHEAASGSILFQKQREEKATVTHTHTETHTDTQTFFTRAPTAQVRSGLAACHASHTPDPENHSLPHASAVCPLSSFLWGPCSSFQARGEERPLGPEQQLQQQKLCTQDHIQASCDTPLCGVPRCWQLLAATLAAIHLPRELSRSPGGHWT